MTNEKIFFENTSQTEI